MEWPETNGKFKPFDTVRDTVSKWQGQVTAAYLYSNGCVRYEVAGADSDGKPDSYTFDEEQLELVFRADELEQAERTGGPRGSQPVDRPKPGLR